MTKLGTSPVPSKVTNEELVSIRHSQLVAAATDLFLRKGFHKTTTREIAEAVGWNMGTLYLYISRKEDVLYLIARRIMHQLAVEQHRVATGPTALATFRAGVEYYFRIVAEMHQELRLLYRESASLPSEYRDAIKQAERRVWNFFSDIIRDGVAAGEFRPVEVGLFAYNVIMLAHMWALKGWALAEVYDFERYLAAQLEAFCSALLGGRGGAPATAIPISVTDIAGNGHAPGPHDATRVTTADLRMGSGPRGDTPS